MCGGSTLGALSLIRRVTARSLTPLLVRAQHGAAQWYLHEHYCTHQTPSTKVVLGRCSRSTCCCSHLPSCGGANTHQTHCWAVEVSTDPSAAGKSSRAGLISALSGSPHSIQNATRAQSAARAVLPRGNVCLAYCRVQSAKKPA